jgi:hypothetical protein
MEAATWVMLKQIFTVVATVYSIDRMRKAKRAAAEAAEARKGFELVVEGSSESLPIVYGRAKVGGVRVWHATRSSYVEPAVNNFDQRFMTGVPNKSIEVWEDPPGGVNSDAGTSNVGFSPGMVGGDGQVVGPSSLALSQESAATHATNVAAMQAAAAAALEASNNGSDSVSTGLSSNSGYGDQ